MSLTLNITPGLHMLEMRSDAVAFLKDFFCSTVAPLKVR